VTLPRQSDLLDLGDVLENAYGCRWRVTHDQEAGDTHVSAVIIEPRDGSRAASRLDDLPLGLHTTIDLRDVGAPQGLQRV